MEAHGAEDVFPGSFAGGVVGGLTAGALTGAAGWGTIQHHTQ